MSSNVAKYVVRWIFYELQDGIKIVELSQTIFSYPPIGENKKKLQVLQLL